METPFDNTGNIDYSTEPVQNIYYFTLYLIDEGGETGPQGHETIGATEEEAELETRDYFREHYSTEINIISCDITTPSHIHM